MSIKVRGLNPDETFCCSKKDFLKVFGSVDEAFTVHFGGLALYSRDGVKNGSVFRTLTFKKSQIIQKRKDRSL